jgi:opacity protein-like surface antigen
MRRTLFIALLAIGLAAPAAASDKEISPGVWRVAFALSAAQGGHGEAVARANRRAASIVLEHGFEYMRILNVKGFALGLTIGTQTTLGGEGPGYAQLIVRGAKGPDDVEGCLARDTRKCATVKVEDVLAKWR